MKKFYLFFLAAVLSMSMFAEGETGKTKGDALPYAWGEGIKVTANAGEGKWYKVDLYGKFNPTTGKSADGNADASILVSNPLDEKANVDVTAYVGDNETSRHFSLQPHEFKTMNIGAGMLVRMGIRYVYMYIVMDVTITPAQADKIEVVVEDAPANSTPFVPVPFNWNNFDNPDAEFVADGNDVTANKETWFLVDWHGQLGSDSIFELHVKNLGAQATTIYGGFATDCPATNIQEQTKEVAAGHEMVKVLEPAMLQMMSDTIYVRVKANQKLHVWAKQVKVETPAEPLFNTSSAIPVVNNATYNLSDSVVYKVSYDTLIAPEYYVTKVEMKNNGASPVELTAKVVKNATGDVFSAVSKTTTIQPGQKLTKELDNTLMSKIEEDDNVYALVLGGNSDVEFKLIKVCTEEDPCIPTPANYETLAWSNTMSGEEIIAQTASKAQGVGTKWWAVDISAAKAKKADIVLTMNAAETANITVDLAAACALGEPTQSYTGSAKQNTKTLSYSLFKDAASVIYVRVKTDKAITVEANWETALVWDGSAWSNGAGPDIEKAARVEGDLIINSEVKALGLTLASGVVTIQNGGKLIVGAEGIKGADSSDKIIVEDGGQLLISPDASQNYKPYITAKKVFEFGLSPDASPILPKMHQLVALSVDDRSANLGIRYYNWDIYRGWITSGTFINTFKGYFIYKDLETAKADYTLEMKGRLADNKNVKLSLPSHGWYPFGNSWLAPIKVSDILSGINGAQQAVHMHIAKHTDLPGGLAMDDDQYVAVTSEMLADPAWAASEWTEVKPMHGFFLYTEGSAKATLNYSKVYPSSTPAPAKATNPATDNRNKVAVVLKGNHRSDFVYMIEGNATNANKLMNGSLSIYAEEGLAQVANENLIGTMLTIQTNEATNYTLSFAMLNGETLYLKDVENGNIIAMTANNVYNFTAEPNTVSARFQVIGRNEVPTGMENSSLIEGANKLIENGRVVIIKNGVKYDVLGAKL